jgi:leucyl aminopeptidase
MNLALSSKPQSKFLIIPVFAKEKIPAVVRAIDKNLQLPALAIADFKNKLGAAQIVYTQDLRIMILGLGERKNFTPASWRSAIFSLSSRLQGVEADSCSLIIPSSIPERPDALVELTGFALTHSSYQFNEYKKDKKLSKLGQIDIVVKNKSKKLEKALTNGITIGLAANESRSLANHPGNHATPTTLANHALALAKKYKFSCTVLEPKEIEKEKMGLLMGVSRGSDEPSRFIVLEYGPKKKPAVALVGKGLTFDSGGISIKPSERMEEMKYDMCGGADVLGIFQAAAELNLPIHLVGIIPSTENLISGKATKPGDILVSKSGVTVEIINTDAEGRLILGDAIDYVKAHFDPRLIIDYATLTGAVLVALGDEYTGFFSNTKKYDRLFAQASTRTAEKFWPLPLPVEYEDHIKSSVAEIRNVGERGLAGATAGGMFLKHFVGETDWIHLDIAGTAWTMRPKSYTGIGATAWGVYLTVDFLRNLKITN